jgi:hypothetical protein
LTVIQSLSQLYLVDDLSILPDRPVQVRNPYNSIKHYCQFVLFLEDVAAVCGCSGFVHVH